MNNFKVHLFIALLSSGLWACTQKTNPVQSTSFIKNRTYAWAQTSKQSEKKSEFNRHTRTKEIELSIQYEVEKELNALGFKFDESNPDFLVVTKATLVKEDNSSSTDWARGNRTTMTSSNGQSANTSGTDMNPHKGNTTYVTIQFLNPDSTTYVMWKGEKSKLVGEAMTLTPSLEKDVKYLLKTLPAKSTKDSGSKKGEGKKEAHLKADTKKEDNKKKK